MIVEQVASGHSTTLELTEVLRATTNVCGNSLHAQMLEFIKLWGWK